MKMSGNSWNNFLYLLSGANASVENVYGEKDFQNLSLELSGMLEGERLRTRDVIIVFAYSLVVLVSLFGNSLVCHVVFSYRNMRTTTNAFIANLAVSDLLMTVLNIPFNLARLLLSNWPFGSIMCALVPFVQVTSVYVSTFTMACIALHRHKVVMDPLTSRLSRAPAVMVVVAVWVAAACLSLPHAVFNEVVQVFSFRKLVRCQVIYPSPTATVRRSVTLFTFLSQYVLPLSVTMIVYGRLVRKVWARQAPGALTPTQEVSSARCKRKTIKMLMLVVIFFALCWLPLNLYHVVHEFDFLRHDPIVFFFCHWLAMSSVCYNPFIYCWLNENFRSGIRAWFTCQHQVNRSRNWSSTLRENRSRSSNRRKPIERSKRVVHRYGKEKVIVCASKEESSAGRSKTEIKRNNTEKISTDYPDDCFKRKQISSVTFL